MFNINLKYLSIFNSAPPTILVAYGTRDFLRCFPVPCFSNFTNYFEKPVILWKKTVDVIIEKIYFDFDIIDANS